MEAEVCVSGSIYGGDCGNGAGAGVVVRRGDGGGDGCGMVEGEEKIRVRVLGDEGDDVAESDWLIW